MSLRAEESSWPGSFRPPDSQLPAVTSGTLSLCASSKSIATDIGYLVAHVRAISRRELQEWKLRPISVRKDVLNEILVLAGLLFALYLGVTSGRGGFLLLRNKLRLMHSGTLLMYGAYRPFSHHVKCITEFCGVRNLTLGHGPRT